MRLVLAVVLAGLVALTQSVSAQDAEEGATPEPNLQEPAPSSEPVPEEPALQLKVDDTGVDIVPSPPATVDGYTLEEVETRVWRAKIGLGVSPIPILVGEVLMIASVSGDFPFEWSPPTPEEQKRDERMLRAGTVLAVGGAAAMITTGILLGVRKRKLRNLREAHYGRPHRVQWDLAQSRLVF